MKVFEEMGNEGVRFDFIIFFFMLIACGRKGMVDIGYRIWDLMIKENLIELLLEYYFCMVDMLSRVGRLKEVEDLFV